MLIVSLRKKTDPSNETSAVNGRKDEATDTGIFFIELYHKKARSDKYKPKQEAVFKLLKLNKLMIDVFVIKLKIISMTPP